jgi:U3 small nucleolar ribonucleoprotein protein IMP4
LAEACRANDVTDLIILHEHRGVPDAVIVSHFPHGPTVFFTLSNVALRHDVATYGESTVSEQYPHLIFEGFSSRLGGRVMDVLRYLFPVPKEDAKRVMTFANQNDFISFRYVWNAAFEFELTMQIISSHHVFVKSSHKEVQLAEVGPRFEMKRESRHQIYRLRFMRTVLVLPTAYEIRQGTIEQTEADREWVLAHYTRTAKKRRQL